MKANHEYEFDFGTIYIFDDFGLSIMNEGVIIGLEENKILRDILNKHFVDRPCGYISYRAFSYSVDPIVYVETSKEENLTAIAVVSDNDLNKMALEVEQKFFNKELKHFNNLEKAKEWISQTIKYHNKFAS
jgi:hypothetical protein